jgi:hypothetical protein
MEIRRISDSVRVTSKHASILVYPTVKTEEADVDIVLGKVSGAKVEIVTPGEYETKEAWIMAFNTDVNEEESNVYLITVEGLNLCVIGSKVMKLSKQQIEKIGLVDIAIAKSEGNDTKVLIENISEIDPQVLIPIGFTVEEIEKLGKDLGVNTIEEQKKYKTKMEDFSVDDYQLKIVKI